MGDCVRLPDTVSFFISQPQLEVSNFCRQLVAVFTDFC